MEATSECIHGMSRNPIFYNRCERFAIRQRPCYDVFSNRKQGVPMKQISKSKTVAVIFTCAILLATLSACVTMQDFYRGAAAGAQFKGNVDGVEYSALVQKDDAGKEYLSLFIDNRSPVTLTASLGDSIDLYTGTKVIPFPHGRTSTVLSFHIVPQGIERHYYGEILLPVPMTDITKIVFRYADKREATLMPLACATGPIVQ